jgi:hypothetical protein
LWLGLRPAYAQSEIRLAALQIQIWPEFDQPSALVILDGLLDSSVPLPAQVTVRIPMAAGQPSAVAVADANGAFMNTAYTTAASDSDVAITLTANGAKFRVEYYDPGLTRSGEARTYSLRWTSDYAVEAATLRVQAPSGSRDFGGVPALSDAGIGEFGLRYYATSLGALEAGETVPVTVSYSKATATLSSESLGLNASTPAPSGVTTTPQLSPWLVGGVAVGLALIIGGVAGYVLASRPRTSRLNAFGRAAPAAKRRHRRESQPPARVTQPPAPADDEATRFCTQCGERAQPGDDFCRSCGAKLRGV